MAGRAVTSVKSGVSCDVMVAPSAEAASRHGDGVATALGPVTSLRFGPRKRRMMTVHAAMAPVRTRLLL